MVQNRESLIRSSVRINIPFGYYLTTRLPDRITLNILLISKREKVNQPHWIDITRIIFLLMMEFATDIQVVRLLITVRKLNVSLLLQSSVGHYIFPKYI